MTNSHDSNIKCINKIYSVYSLPQPVRFPPHRLLHAKSLQLCPTIGNPMVCSPPGSSVHGILQARILQWVAMPSSRGSFWPGTEPVSLMSLALADGFITTSTVWQLMLSVSCVNFREIVCTHTNVLVNMYVWMYVYLCVCLYIYTVLLSYFSHLPVRSWRLFLSLRKGLSRPLLWLHPSFFMAASWWTLTLFPTLLLLQTKLQWIIMFICHFPKCGNMFAK